MKNNIYRQIKNKYQETIDKFKNLTSTNIKKKLYINDIEYDKSSKIAIIVAYRQKQSQDKETQLNQFIEYYHNYIDNIDIYVIEQSEDGKNFNRGCLFNCGFDIAEKVKKYDMYIFHNIDLLTPDELKNIYTYSSPNPIRITSLSKNSENITSFSADAYKKINGYPNNFYGCGGEDDAVYHRMIMCSMILYKLKSNNKITQPTPEIIETDDLQKKHTIMTDMNIWETSGLSNLKYTINDETKLKYNNIKKYIVNI